MGEKNSSIKFSGLGVADIDIGKQQRNNCNNLATADKRNKSIWYFNTAETKLSSLELTNILPIDHDKAHRRARKSILTTAN